MSQPAPGRLLDILGLGFGLAGAVGGTIGAGILRTPGLVAAQLPSPALGDWVDSLAALVLVALGYAASRLIRVSQAGS
jgi:APA family basic amino acid/polyamine antiporter